MLQNAIHAVSHAWPVIILGLVIIVALVVLYWCMDRLGRNRNVVEMRVVSADVARRHIGIICLIRAGEALVVIPLVLLAVLIGYGFFLGLINPFRPQDIHGKFFSIIMLVAVLLVSAGVIAKWRHRSPVSLGDLIAKLRRVTTNSVSNFAYIFSGFAAHDIYQLMPDNHFPVAGTSLLMDVFFNRDIFWIIAFFTIKYVVKSTLLRILELNASASPQNSLPATTA